MLMVPIRIENTGRRLSSAQRRSKGSLAKGQRRWYIQWYGMGQKVRRKEIVSPRVVYRASQVLSMPVMTGRMYGQNLAWHNGRLFDGASRIVYDASQPASCYSAWHEVGGR